MLAFQEVVDCTDNDGNIQSHDVMTQHNNTRAHTHTHTHKRL